MILAIDAGNTNVVIGGYIEKELKFVFRIRTDRYKTSDEYAALIASIVKMRGYDTNDLEGGVISSVVPNLYAVLSKALKRMGAKNVLTIGPGIKTGLDIRIDMPSQLGSDMVASGAAVLKNYTCPAIVIDLGTATKISCIDKNGAIIGCSIMPGVNISLDALVGKTAQLALVSLEGEVNLIGKNTVDSIKSGSVLGTASMIDGMIDRYREELDENLTAIATGGIAPNIIPYCKSKIITDQNIVLNGLFIIYEKNI